MRDKAFLEEEITKEDLAACTSILTSENDNFGTLIFTAGINPATDFINGDLSGCDFSNTDIRGFNFSGANLRGVVLANTQWDRSTNLVGADISGTGFVFEQGQNSFFENNPKWERMAGSLAQSDWIGVELWLGKDRNEAETAVASRIAFEIYRKIDNTHIKSIILMHARYQFADREEYKDFLISELAKPLEPLLAISCLNILSRLFPNEPQVKAICGVMLSSEFENVRSAALAALMNGIRGTRFPEFLLDNLKRETSGTIRRNFLRRVVRRMSNLHILAASEVDLWGVCRDFLDPISSVTINRIADLHLNGSHIVDVVLSEEESRLPPRVKPNSRAAFRYIDELKRRKKARSLFEDLKKIGVPFQFSE